MSSAIITVENLGKKYRLKHQAERQRYTTLRDTIAGKVKSLFQKQKVEIGNQKSTEDFWALKDVSFEVKQGDVVGIIGRNGAGKSTLLKILSRITEPTEGRVHIKGRVASLLEVGTGFHPELTGRENVFLNGAILGMSRVEIRKKFDEIVAFAEVEKFLDTPVKRYSSGMYVRLAFAVAAHLEPEILIVDEVLAVGDAEFQKKCLGKMQDVSKGGRTVLFVSHNMTAVEHLCSTAMLFSVGRILEVGPVNKTIETYLGSLNPESGPTAANTSFGGELLLEQIAFTPNPVCSGQSIEFLLELEALADQPISDLVLLLYSDAGMRVAIADLRCRDGLPWLVKRDVPWRLKGRLSSVPLVEGLYRVGLYVRSASFNGDVYDLATLRVETPNPHPALLPYPVRDRGVVHLEAHLGIASLPLLVTV